MKLNTKPNTVAQRTHEGAPADRMTAEQALRRSVLSCLLWEREFYESGQSIADRIETLAATVPAPVVMALAVEARSVFNLRHAPLLLLLSLVKRGGAGVAKTIADTIQRPDEITELLAIYWRNGKKPVPAQMKKGLALAFGKFNEYSLAKYNRDGAVKLRDAMFLAHPKPANLEQELLFAAVAAGTLAIPDTWETALSGGANKRETFTRLISEGKLGYLALLRNLRNMAEAGVGRALVNNAILARKGGAERVLPFRYVAAARAAAQFEPALDVAMQAAVAALEPLAGRTFILCDVSGSMYVPLTAKSDMKRSDAAAALAVIVPSRDARVFTFSSNIVEVPRRAGMGGIDAIHRSQGHNSTDLHKAITTLNGIMRPEDRLIVISDEQANALAPKPVAGRAYMINVASYKNGVSYRDGWVHLDGFSEGVLRYIAEIERG
jgi:60 kDa SS-A/Ro ribonucleoprotein